ncbi:MAG TPA: phosphoadenylyl-sulfate reductase [Alphaproteobacteria bacterium]|nr:phosphoadenylyl-sulfate reductase [Alphaproteobacteria bacterium]
MSEIQTLFEEFKSKNSHLEAEELIDAADKFFAKGKLVSFSSFGSWSALLLDMVAKVNNEMPILFLETQKHFPETLQYVEDIKQCIQLRNVIALKPDDKILTNIDPQGELWKLNVDRCCWIRKVEPLDRYIEETSVQAVITGRRAYQTKERQKMETIEMDDKGKIRLNPLAFWSKDKIKEEFAKRSLLQHPLVEQGYHSIGCAPCTRAVNPGEDERSGRWAHVTDYQPNALQKTECGIHLGAEETKDWVI